jgi:cellulose synthase/poly-beta-1,6-N-acetylglucosamine synthase-like glycosyltransferase
VIEKKIQNIFSLNYPENCISLVIVDDASDDNTVEIIKGFKDSRITLVEQSERSGKAAGINLGMTYIDTELVMLVDARQTVSENSLKDLSSWFYPDANVAAVSGEVKFLEKDANETGMDAYQKYEKFIRNSEASLNGVPGVSGALYMLKRDKFKPIPEDTILDDVLIPMVASQEGDWVGFDERAIAWDIPSDDMAREKRRKKRTLNGNYQLLFRNWKWCIPGFHPLGFEFVSHKVLRLTAPFLAILALILSSMLAYEGDKVYMLVTLLISITIISYPIVLFVPFLEKIKLIRLLSSFVALNWFNVLGFIDYLSNRKSASWK